MARIARVEIFAPDEIAIAHVLNRTVRRCFLMGNDPVSGKNFDHRIAWMETDLQSLAKSMGIDLLCMQSFRTTSISTRCRGSVG